MRIINNAIERVVVWIIRRAMSGKFGVKAKLAAIAEADAFRGEETTWGKDIGSGWVMHGAVNRWGLTVSAYIKRADDPNNLLLNSVQVAADKLERAA